MRAKRRSPRFALLPQRGQTVSLQTRLGERIAYHIVRRVGRSPLGRRYASCWRTW